MAKNINVKLTFSADTKAAQQQINQLQQTLSNIAATPISGSGLKATAQEIQAATNKAVELKVALNNATNVNTGKLNFNKFSQELKRNKTTLQEYAMQLQKLGPQGVQAFSQMATAIRQSETPLVAMQGKLAALGQTFMNTIKWSISSSMIQGVTRAFSSTIDYAKELNESLNNIRIVTGKSVADVTQFAQEANKAAKALSATTDEYAKASLIYFQQGLNDSAVAERTETTLKLAKVVGESAETTSEWMTAIWNNFDDGSRSLENYADVLAKLGAATASSADEIAGGLEKFAAVAETVGLSYEYAAAALATITAETRQSEDVVGTALKTIFARVENLKLGETLEDGTTLGQYSEALAKVGVNIKDSNGQLKEMDNILSEIGITWGILNRDQQVALAQQVAGIRQYSQFMALMDNWDVMEKNVELAKEANGALEDQHNIWETGIEGATQRVKEELNEIKNNLLGENDLLPLLNIAEGFLDFVGDLVDSLGGLPGLLSIIASVGLKLWGPQAAASLQSMVNGVKSLYSVASGQAQAQKNEVSIKAAEIAAGMQQNLGASGKAGSAKSEILQKEAELTALIEGNEKNISKENLEQINVLRQLLKLQEDLVTETAEKADNAQEQTDKTRQKMLAKNISLDEMDVLDRSVSLEHRANTLATEEMRIDDNGVGNIEDIYAIDTQAREMMSDVQAGNGMGVDPEQLAEVKNEYNKISEAAKKYCFEAGNLARQEEALAEITDQNSDDYKKLQTDITKTKDEMAKQTKIINQSKQKMAENVKATNKYENALGELKEVHQDASDIIDEYDTNLQKTNKETINLEKSQKDLRNGYKNIGEVVEDSAKAGQGWATSFVNGMQGVASAAAGIQMLVSSFDNLTTSLAEGEFGFSEFLSVLTSVGFAIPMLVPLFKTLGDMIHFDAIKTKIATSMKNHLAKAEKKRADKAMANAAKVKAANEVEQSSDKATIATKLGKLFASGPWGWAIAAVAIAAIAGLGLAINASVSNKQAAKEEEQQQEKDIETAEKSVEAAQGWKTEANAMDALIVKHKQLQKANEDTIKGHEDLLKSQQAIIDTVPKLIEKYKELNDINPSLNMDGTIVTLEAAAANEDIEQIETITNTLDSKIAESLGSKSGDIYQGARSKTNKAINDAELDEFEVKWINADLIKILNKYTDSNGTLGGSMPTGLWADFAGISPEQLIGLYENLQNYVKKMQDEGVDPKSYKDVQKYLSELDEAIPEIQKLVKEQQSYKVMLEGYNKLKDLSVNATYEDYENLKIAMQDASKEDQTLINDWLKEQKQLSAFYALDQKVTNYSSKYGKSFGEDIKQYAKKLTTESEDLTAFLKIDFDKFQVKEQWDELTEYIKHLDEGDKLQKDVTDITSAEKNLKSNGTVEDYKKLQESLSWGQNGLIQYSDFLAKSYEQQKAYLEDIKIKKSAAAQAEYDASLKQLKITRQQYQLQLEEAKLKSDTFLQGQIEADLYNLNKLIEEAETNIELSRLAAKQANEARAERIRTRKNNIKALQDELDVYRHINELSDDLARNMDRITEAKDAAYGANYVALLDAEIEGLKTENKLLDQTIKLADKRAKANRDELSKKYGAEFDAFGNFSNYNEVQAQYLKSLAKLDSDSQAYKNKKDEYDDFIKLAEDYNEDLEQSENATDKKASNMREILDKKLEGIEYTISINLEVNEHRRNIVDRILEGLDDDAYDGAARIAKYGRKSSLYYDDVTEGAQGIRKTLKAAKVSDKDIEAYMAGKDVDLTKYNLTSATIEQLDQFTEQMASGAEGLREMESAIKEEFMAGVDAWTEKISEQTALIESQGNMLSNYRNIVDLLGKNNRFGLDKTLIKDMRQASVDIANASVTTARVQKETTEAALLEATTKKNAAKQGSEEYQLWLEQEEILQKQLAEDTENFTSTWINAINTAYEAFEEAGNEAIEELKKAILGIGGGMEDAMSMFERAGNRFISASEKAYELSKLNRTIQKQIDATDNVKAQKVWKAFQDEINEKQAAGVQMSKQDLEVMKKRYDLKLAEIALEEAQQAKSVVRLTRDSEGNYGYTYTADQNAVATAEQNYEDALYAAQKTNEDYLDNLSSQIIANRKEMADKLAELDINDYANAEDYYAARQKIIDEYTEHENYLWEEIQKTLQNNQRIYDEDVQAFGSFVGQQGSVADAWTLKFDQTAIAIVGKYGSIEEAQNQLATAIGDGTSTGYTGAMNSAYNQLQSNLDATVINMGGSIETLNSDFSDAMYGEGGTKENPTGGIVGNTKDAESAASDYGKTAVKKFGDIALAVSDWYKIYKPKVEKATSKTNTLEESLASLKENYNTKVNVNTTQAQENINALIEAIGNIEKAIKKLKDTNFKITANVNITTGDGSPPDDDPGRDKYTYHIDRKQTAAAASASGYVRLEDGSGNYVGYAKESSLQLNTSGDMANVTNSKDFYKYMIYDANDKSKVLGGIGALNEGTASTQWDIEPENFLSFNGKYSKLSENDQNALKDALKSRAGYIRVGGTNYYGFKHGDNWHFASIDSFAEASGIGEHPRLKKGAKYYKGNITWFDTGGYTGEWGPEGRLAMLHQKEIVLNAHDTENLLTAVSMIREISSQLESNALAMQYIGSLGKVYSAIHTGGDTLQQEVHITAEFPNATDHNEIEEAFRNLTNLASQYANRKS